ncbi:MAG: bifunctional (p)ppGpp synthetase/guanosine-3',5'-bis(diphosphate) 3'-pyrophosphohydrolase [Oscillospiraceae bacterium]|nr:bifunctional (p)ppGpp synthetase/guanosine-3',5'-bis(diphosphate) 3'-pyrophosphohydrolase [Oscillospiraceae bacterium]
MTEDRVVTFDMIMEKILTSDKQYDTSKIICAYQFAAKAHEGQFRSSGQPYIIHPLAVAELLLGLGMDTDTVCAALLHDVVEDTPVTDEQLRDLFGKSVAALVDGVTKLTQIPVFRQDQKKAENILKMLLAMDEDVRVMIIKLCDRMHNMRTLQFRPENKQQQTAYETMNVYAPIAGRLGMKQIQEELETLSLYFLDPFGYSEIIRQFDNTKEERESFIEAIKNRISEALKDAPLRQPPEIQGRPKSIYGMYKKLYKEHKSFEQIYDKYAVRVIVDTVPECYMVLGVIHQIYKPLMERIKDWISRPKENGYQSLHTTVLGREGIPFEVQIRTREMHKTAEYGIAAHWKYKQGVQSDNMEEQLAWVRKILEAQKTSDDPDEILTTLKIDLSPDNIMVMTPKGDAITLPLDATPIDFAYKIHTEIGHKMTFARVEGRMVPLDYKLHTGEICEIVTSKDPNKGPNRAWMNIAKTSEAKAKIRAWFKKENRQSNIEAGKTMLEKEFRRSKIHIPDEEFESFFTDDMKRHSCNTIEDFYASVGYGGVSIYKLMPKWRERYLRLYRQEEEVSETESIVRPVEKTASSQIILDEIRSCEHKLAKCCNPLYGDDIVGFVTRGHGLSVHRTDCINYRAVLSRNNPEELERWLSVQWTGSNSSKMRTDIDILAYDRVGLMFDISAVMKEAGMSMEVPQSHKMKSGKILLVISIQVINKTQLTAILERLRKIRNIISVERSSSAHNSQDK